MVIGKTLTGIALAGALATGGYFVGNNAAQDKEYGIKRDETGVYLQVKATGDNYEMKMYGKQLVVGNNSDQIIGMYKIKLTDEITTIVSQKMSGNTLENRVTKSE